MTFAGRVAIVTGAASGIGEALAWELASRGARVVRTDRAPGPEIERLDVTDADAFRALVRRTVEREGRLDLLFNNAGIGLAGEVRDLALDDWRRVLDVNFWGVVHGVAAAYPVMVEQKSGHIVNVASGAGLLPRPGMVAYAASKHAVVGLSTSLRAEARALGVRVSAVCPGYVATRILERTTWRGIDGHALAARLPGRPASARTCARAILAGVARDRAVITIGPLLALEWLVYRAWPSLGISLSELRVRAMRRHRA